MRRFGNTDTSRHRIRLGINRCILNGARLPRRRVAPPTSAACRAAEDRPSPGGGCRQEAHWASVASSGRQVRGDPSTARSVGRKGGRRHILRALPTTGPGPVRSPPPSNVLHSCRAPADRQPSRPYQSRPEQWNPASTRDDTQPLSLPTISHRKRNGPPTTSADRHERSS